MSAPYRDLLVTSLMTPKDPGHSVSRVDTSKAEAHLALMGQVSAHLDKQHHARTTAELIDLIITRYPSCPLFASYLVDRLLEGHEGLAEALQEEVQW